MTTRQIENLFLVGVAVTSAGVLGWICGLRPGYAAVLVFGGGAIQFVAALMLPKAR